MSQRRKHNRGTSEPAPFSRQQMAVCGLVLLVATLTAYGNVTSHDFVRFDDNQHLSGNPHLNPLTWKGLGQLWAEPFFGEYVPVTYTLFAAESWLSGRTGTDAETAEFNPAVFHTGSLLLHLGCVWLVFLLLRRLTRHTWGALCGALLFSLHPLQAESVAWVSETRGLLAACFSLLALNAYLSFAGVPGNFEQPAAGQATEASTVSRQRWAAYAGATAWLILALLSKPSAVALPLLAGVLDVAIAKRGWRAAVLSLLPWLLLAGGFALWTRSMQPGNIMTFVSPIWSRPLIAADALAFYLYKLAWPAMLGIHYPRSPEVLLEGQVLYWTWLLPAACLMLLLAIPAARKYWPAAALFVAAVAPVLGLVPFGFQNYSTVADRYAYLAMLGPALAAAWLLARHWTFNRAALAAMLLLPLAWLSYQQSQTWRDSHALFARALEVNPRSWLARMNRGCLLRDQADRALREGATAQAEPLLADAMEDFNQAIECHPRQYYPSAYMHRASVHWLRGDRPQAMEDYTESIRLWPDNPNSYFNRGLAHQELGEYQQAVDDYTQAIELQPDYADAYNNRGVVQELLHNPEEAIADYTRFIELRPFNADGYLMRTHILRELERTAEAVEDLSKAIELRPTQALYETRATFYLRLNNWRMAQADVDTIRQLGGQPNPGLVQAIQARADRVP
ncbi:MAG: tetratricopeptide repeat protein [Pirellulales bacterium]